MHADLEECTTSLRLTEQALAFQRAAVATAQAQTANENAQRRSTEMALAGERQRADGLADALADAQGTLRTRTRQRNGLAGTLLAIVLAVIATR